MYLRNNVHWHEGLFLQPHHMQIFQKNIADGFKHANQSMLNYPTGVIESGISPGDLSLGQLKYEKLKLVMESGLFIDINDNTDLTAFDLKDFLKGKNQAVNIEFGIPLWKNTKSNTYYEATPVSADDKPVIVPKTYKLDEIDFNDENTGDNPKVIQVKKLNARLFISNTKDDNKEEKKDYEVITIGKLVKSGKNEAGIINDESYIPSCLFIDGSKILMEKLKTFLNTVTTSAGEHMKKLATSPVFYSENGKVVRPILKLLLLSKYSASLSQHITVPRLTPYQVYSELLSMYGEFCGLSADENVFNPPGYDHNDLTKTFSELITLLEEKIKFFYKINPYIRTAFQLNDKQDLLTLKLTDEQIKNGVDFILSVSANMSSRDIMSIVEKGTGFKVMSPGTARGKAVPGLKLTGYFDKNFQLPQTPGTCYFQIGFSDENPLWKAIVKEKELAIVCRKQDMEKLNIELFVMLPEKQEIENGTE